jgi:hypothetical protein
VGTLAVIEGPFPHAERHILLRPGFIARIDVALCVREDAMNDELNYNLFESRDYR